LFQIYHNLHWGWFPWDSARNVTSQNFNVLKL
jgi:hypothetical protein